jgi:hypothetical protein
VIAHQFVKCEVQQPYRRCVLRLQPFGRDALEGQSSAGHLLHQLCEIGCRRPGIHGNRLGIANNHELELDANVFCIGTCAKSDAADQAYKVTALA